MKQIICYVFLITSNVVIAQNLVNNTSFEEIGFLTPENSSGLKYWFKGNKGTSDGVEGKGKCRTGIRCVSMINFSESGHREYIRTQLKDTLEKGAFYYASFFVRTTKISAERPYLMNRFGALFSSEKTNENTWDPIIAKPSVEMSQEQFLSYDEGWREVWGIYKAEGNERYVTFGNFYSSDQVDIKLAFEGVKKKSWTIHYFMDDVQVQQIKDSITFTLYFNTDEYLLTTFLTEQIKQIMQLYSSKEFNTIKLSGHTDSSNTASYNEELSKKRVLSVKKYIQQHHKIPEASMKLSWFGEAKPITGASEKRKNRRVELTLIK